MQGLKRVLQRPKGRRVADANIIISDVRWDRPFLHRVADRLHVAGAERQVVGRGRRTGRLEVDRRRGGAARRFGTKHGVLELQERFDVEVFLMCSRAVAGRVLLVEPSPVRPVEDASDALPGYPEAIGYSLVRNTRAAKLVDGDHVVIGEFCFVVMLAERHAIFLGHVALIIQIRSWEQMVWIAARPEVTGMAHQHLIGDRTLEVPVTQNVDSLTEDALLATPDFDLGISLVHRECRLADPASVFQLFDAA